MTSTTWPRPPHTGAKHEILRAYLKAWYPIIGKWNQRAVIIDGFAGPGIYSGGEPGSPIVAIETLLEHTASPATTCEFVFVFMEADAERCASLEEQLTKLRLRIGGAWPNNVVVLPVEQTSFVDGADRILASVSQLAPTLALVDPFGFKGAPITLVRDLLSFPQCEVIFNFMFDGINRFATAGIIDEHFADLFGCNDFAGAPQSGLPRKEFLRDLYERQLHTVGGFKYTRWFEMVNERGRTGNYVFYGTRHEKGLDCMKRAMWKVDPELGRRFADREDGMISLFAAEPVVDQLRDQVVERYSGQTVSIEDVERFVLTDTDYLPGSHLKRRVLQPLEKAGGIVGVVGRTKPRSFPSGCKISFV